ncbi:hypothetical protein TNCV_3582321 [Trichonephila clavipes]|nr:hypothetical protein TNCV_3582321 [Trichonephila clavipes]
MDQGSHPDISHQSEFLPETHAGQCDHRVRSLPKPLFHHLGYCVFQQWSATSCGAEILHLRAERAIKQSSGGIAASGQPGTCLLAADASF